VDLLGSTLAFDDDLKGTAQGTFRANGFAHGTPAASMGFDNYRFTFLDDQRITMASTYTYATPVALLQINLWHFNHSSPPLQPSCYQTNLLDKVTFVSCH